MTARHGGERLGACTDCRRYWAMYRAGEIGDEEIVAVESRLATTAGTCPVIPLAHSYGPLDDFRRRLEAARDAGSHGFWINRYGYLSDAKLAVLAELAAS